MATYVMSDIHGVYEKFKEMLKTIHFSDNDTLYILGDVIDRGKESIPLLLDIMERENIILMLGNHELMMYEVYDKGKSKDTWYWNGGQNTDTQFLSLSSWEQDNILDYIWRLPVIIPNLTLNGRTHYLAHSTFLDNRECLQTKSMVTLSAPEVKHVVWEREYPYYNIKCANIYPEVKNSILITGHTITEHYYINETQYTKGHIFHGHKNHFIGIDCGCAAYAIGKAYGRLGCLRLDDGKEFYV